MLANRLAREATVNLVMEQEGESARLIYIAIASIYKRYSYIDNCKTRCDILKLLPAWRINYNMHAYHIICKVREKCGRMQNYLQI
jgi:hypothetical protein